MQIINCRVCGSTNFIKNLGELICTQCGYILHEDHITYEPEWTVYDKGEVRGFIRSNTAPTTPLIQDYGYGTIDTAKLTTIRSRRKRKGLLKTESESTHRQLQRLIRIAEQMNTPQKIVEHASQLYREAIQHKEIEKVERRSKLLPYTVLYISMKLHGYTAPQQEYLKQHRIEKKKNEFNRLYRAVLTKLKIHIPPTTPKDYLEYISRKLDMNEEEEKLYRELLNRYNTESGKPFLTASALAYLVLKKTRNIQHTEIEDKLDLARDSIKRRVSRLKKK